jgi:ABC-type antimicrobial peptide transport system permease subunit
VLTQAAVLAVVGLGFGVPLGLAAGRVLWRLVAALTPLQFQPPDAAAVLLVVPVVLVVVAALTAWPGRRATRLRVGQALRSE